MDRRTFIAAAVAGLAAPDVWAQQRVAAVRLGILSGGDKAEEMTETGLPQWRAFFGELRRLGLVEGETLIVERWTGRDVLGSERADFARRLVANRPDVVFTTGTGTAGLVMAETATIPIVIGGGDPLGRGLVDSLRRPGGNLTGFSGTTGPGLWHKALQLLREAVPGTEPIAWLLRPGHWENDKNGMREAASRLGIKLVPALVEEPIDEQAIVRAFASLPEWSNRAMFVGGGSRILANARVIAAEALKARIPAINNDRVGADAGLLMSYGRNRPAIYTGAAGYVARIARGDDPAELPIQQPSVFDFVVNLQTARALGITLPNTILYRATEVIE